MALRDWLLEVAAGWPDYRVLQTTSSLHPEYALVVEGGKRELKPLLPQRQALKVKGSTGSGNITAAPWIATFDRTITSTATQGYYVVYLFSVDLQRVYLSLAFGTTQFEEYFRDLNVRHRKFRSAAGHLQRLLRSSRPLELGSLNLSAAQGEKLHVDYQQANIAAIEYDLINLPNNEQLVADYKFMIELYRELVENPLTPTIQELFEAEVVPPPGPTTPIVSTFVERVPTGRKGKGKKGYRLSKESKKIGDRGELVVYEYERARVRTLGLDPDNLVRWVSRDGETPGWDISSIDDTRTPIFIEVKASVGRTVQSLLVTANEWIAAGKHGPSYRIYLVTEVMKAQPKIEVIVNPADLVAKGILQVETASWCVGLTSTRAVGASVAVAA